MTATQGEKSGAARALLTLGIFAGPLYVALALAQILVREGFDVRRHAVSLLSNGDLGWIQILNFLVAGALVGAGALGSRQAHGSALGGNRVALLLGLYGAGLIGSGVFSADPAQGFPPGSDGSAEVSTSGVLHFVFGGIGFFAVIVVCFVIARRYAKAARRRMAAWSAATGLAFFLAFAAVATGSTSPVVMLSFYFAVAWIWAWHTMVLMDARRSLPAR